MEFCNFLGSLSTGWRLTCLMQEHNIIALYCSPFAAPPPTATIYRSLSPPSPLACCADAYRWPTLSCQKKEKGWLKKRENGRQEGWREGHRSSSSSSSSYSPPLQLLMARRTVFNVNIFTALVITRSLGTTLPPHHSSLLPPPCQPPQTTRSNIHTPSHHLPAARCGVFNPHVMSFLFRWLLLTAFHNSRASLYCPARPMACSGIWVAPCVIFNTWWKRDVPSPRWDKAQKRDIFHADTRHERDASWSKDENVQQGPRFLFPTLNWHLAYLVITGP